MPSIPTLYRLDMLIIQFPLKRDFVDSNCIEFKAPLVYLHSENFVVMLQAAETLIPVHSQIIQTKPYIAQPQLRPGMLSPNTSILVRSSTTLCTLHLSSYSRFDFSDKLESAANRQQASSTASKRNCTKRPLPRIR